MIRNRLLSKVRRDFWGCTDVSGDGRGQKDPKKEPEEMRVGGETGTPVSGERRSKREGLSHRPISMQFLKTLLRVESTISFRCPVLMSRSF